jgi:hypothetical protein
MANKRVISECINVRINVGNYQHIEITKQASEEIEYENDEQRLELEQGLTNDLIDSVIKTMRTVPERLGKGVENAQDVEEAIAKAIPEWLEKNPPNLADKPKEAANKSAAEAKAHKDAANDLLDVEETPVVEKAGVDEEDLFEDDEPPAKSEVIEEEPEEAKTSPSETTPVEEKKEPVAAGTSDFDFFDDDDMDLFED